MVMQTEGAPAPMKRFVFLLSGGPEVIDGSDVEMRAEVQIDAEQKVAALESAWGCTAKLIGLREGIGSSARFLPLVRVSELPAHIVQNERFAGSAPCDSCMAGTCMLCDDDGRRDAETARLERLHTAHLNSAFWGERRAV